MNIEERKKVKKGVTSQLHTNLTTLNNLHKIKRRFTVEELNAQKEAKHNVDKSRCTLNALGDIYNLDYEESKAKIQLMKKALEKTRATLQASNAKKPTIATQVRLISNQACLEAIDELLEFFPN